MLVKYLFKKWYLVVLYLATIIAAPIVNMYAAYRSGDMLDYATDGQYDQFVSTLLIFLIYFVVHGALLFVVQTVRTRIVSVCRRELRSDMFSHVMSADNSFFSKPDSGFHIAAFSNDITILESHYFETWLQMLEGVLSIATAIVGIFNLHTHLAIIIVGGEIFAFLVCFIVRGYAIKKNKAYIEKLAQFTQRIKDYFSSFQMIHNYSVEAQIKKRFNRMNDDTENAKDDADMSLAFVNRLANM